MRTSREPEVMVDVAAAAFCGEMLAMLGVSGR
jgi:hypothetical protein